MRILFLALVLAALGSGCTEDCALSGCPAGTYCSEDGCYADCYFDEDCYAYACDPAVERCSAAPRCDATGRCTSAPIPSSGGSSEAIFPPHGWDDPPGAGLAFVLDQIAVADAGTGADIDGRCPTLRGCVDNALAPVGLLVNDQLRQLLLGETTIIVEIAGLAPDFRGFDESVTVKIYGVEDADDPPFPANNFRAPPGSASCCEFIAPRTAVDANGHVLARIPARIQGYRIVSTEPADIAVQLASCPEIWRIARATFAGRLAPTLDRLDDGVLSGVFRSRDLEPIPNPYCQGGLSSRCPFAQATDLGALARAAGSSQVDIDLDGDGRECVYDLDGDGRIDLCCDGVGNDVCPVGDATICGADRIAPLDDDDPSSCLRSPRMGDGHSIAFAVSGVAARVNRGF